MCQSLFSATFTVNTGMNTPDAAVDVTVHGDAQWLWLTIPLGQAEATPLGCINMQHATGPVYYPSLRHRWATTAGAELLSLAVDAWNAWVDTLETAA